MRSRRGKQNIIIIILIIIIALLAVYIFFGDQLFGKGGETPQATSSEGLSQQELDEFASAHPSEFGDGISQQGGVPDNSSEVVIANDNEELFTDPDSYSGRQIKIEGTIYNDPQNNQGILAFNIKTDTEHTAFVNYLDEKSTLILNKGDKVSIFGVATGAVQSEDESGAAASMIMINATSIEMID